MSWEAMQAMRDHSQASGTSKVLGMAVASYAERDTALAWPSNEELKRWGFAERTIQAGLRQLERLGELVRQPDRETHARRRVYLVAPHARAQLALDLGAYVAPAISAPAKYALAGAAHARAGKEPHEPHGNQPPLSPPGGGAGKLLVAEGSQALQLTARSERVAVRRRRRRRRRDDDGASFASGVDCPLIGLAVEARRGLDVAWENLRDRLRTELGDSRVEIWLARAHLHRAGEVLELGLPVDMVGWVPGRFGRFLEQVAGRPITFVGCNALGLESVT